MVDLTKYFLVWVNFSFPHTVTVSKYGKTRNTMPRKIFFVQSIYTVKFFSKMLIWRIIWDKTLAAKFRSFQHRKNDRKIFREINSLVTYLVNRWFHNIFVKQVWSRENFCNFHTLTVLLLCFIVEQQLSITLQNSSKHVMTFVQIIRYTTFSSVSYLKF